MFFAEIRVRAARWLSCRIQPSMLYCSAHVGQAPYYEVLMLLCNTGEIPSVHSLDAQ